jgi:hypothetical protein
MMTRENRGVRKNLSQCRFVHRKSYINRPDRTRSVVVMLATNCLNHRTIHVWPHPRFALLDIEMGAAPSGALTHDVRSAKITVLSPDICSSVRACDDLLEDKQVREEISYFCVAVPGDCIDRRKRTVPYVPSPFLHETADNDSVIHVQREREREINRKDIGFAVICGDFQTVGRDHAWFAGLPVIRI